jgi:hypothetical protein
MSPASPCPITLGPNWRVRPCDHLQWVLERRHEARPSRLERRGESWGAWAYCRTRAGLETALSRLRSEGIVLNPTPLAILPSYYPEPTKPSPETASPATEEEAVEP